jgi:hypothetical protein
MTGAIHSHNARGSEAPSLSIRLVDGVVVDTGAALEENIG